MSKNGKNAVSLTSLNFGQFRQIHHTIVRLMRDLSPGLRLIERIAECQEAAIAKEIAFGVKAVERAGGRTGGGEKGVIKSTVDSSSIIDDQRDETHAMRVAQ